jgi:hypothetical protein
MVERHLTVPYEFYCFTDHVNLFDLVTGKIHFKSFPRYDMEGWWNKLQLFNPETNLHGVNLYMDLDVVILKNIDCFAHHGDENTFGILNDFGQPTTIYNSSIMKWNNSNASSLIWDKYFSDRISWRKVQGDQNVITELMKKNALLIPFPDEWTFSYKWFSRTQPRFAKNLWTFEQDVKAKVAVFHGNPNPHESNQEWVKTHWK